MNILYADDDPTMTMLTQITLENAGHRVRHCVSGIEVITLIESGAYQPDLILTDFHMPGMDADAMVERLRRIKSSMDTPIIVISGSLMKESALENMDIIGVIDKTGNLMKLPDEISRMMAEAGKS